MIPARSAPFALAAALVFSPALCGDRDPTAAARPVVLPLTASAIPGGAPTALDPAPGLLHVAFFATWCGPCRDELPKLADLVARWDHEGYRVVVMAVSTRQGIERLERFAEHERVPGVFMSDATGAVSRALGIEAIPSHVFFDASGAIVLRSSRIDERTEAEIDRLLRGAPRTETTR